MSDSPFGILNINKPKGDTSRYMVSQIHKLIKPHKAGHAGTLDPMATGVLLICLGTATRLVPHLQDRKKKYVAEFILGQTSDTDDVTGKITHQTDCVPISKNDLESLLPQWIGEVQQTPPAYSAVHVNGKRAYDLARKGRDFELKAKTVQIDSLKLTHFEWPNFRLEMECGSGTYVRSLGRDLGKELGCGAVMSSLVRTAIGDFTIEDSVSVEEITKESISKHSQSSLKAIPELTVFEPNEIQLKKVDVGNPFRLESDQSLPLEKETSFAIVTNSGRLKAIAEFDETNGMLWPKQVFK